MLEGRVTVNRETVRELGTKADPEHDDIRVDGRRIHVADRPALPAAEQAARVRHHAVGSRETSDRHRPDRRPRLHLPRRPAGFRLGRPAAPDQRRRPCGQADASEPRGRTRLRSARCGRAGRPRPAAAGQGDRHRRTPHRARPGPPPRRPQKRRRPLHHDSRRPQPSGQEHVRRHRSPGRSPASRGHRSHSRREAEARALAGTVGEGGRGVTRGGNRHGPSGARCSVPGARCSSGCQSVHGSVPGSRLLFEVAVRRPDGASQEKMTR